MSDRLKQICDDKRLHVTTCKTLRSESELLVQAKAASAPRGFARALREKVDAGGVGLIAEIKKASPSKGLIRADFNPPLLARAYADGGATCLSVLTDVPYFQGDDRYVAAARAACALPVLRKDFMLEPYQIIESRVLEADAVLLIMAALDDGQAAELERCAMELGMDVLIEVHDAQELERALRLKSPLVGVNNRNLKTMEISLEVSEQLAAQMPAEKIRVCESGIFTAADVARMKDSGFQCFLVGESLMRQQDVTQAVKQLLGDAA